MYYCETSGRNCYRFSLPNQINDPVQSWMGTMIALLKVLLTPEASSRTPALLTGKTINSWLGPVKALFWVINAIAIGIILARVCS